MSDTEAMPVSRSQMHKHEDLVDYLTSEGHINPKSTQAEVIAAAFANRNEYRSTDRYRNLVDTHRASAEQAKAQRAAEREAAKAQKAAEAEAAKTAEPKATKAAASKAAPAKAAKAPAKAAKKAPATKGDNPFE